jgi:pimeloyl-ACP methyl ester carboxylesterase
VGKLAAATAMPAPSKVAPSMSQIGALLGCLLALSGCMPPSWGAAALLHPSRKALTEDPPLPAESVQIAGDAVNLKGWLFRAAGERRGTIVYLHGSADNRASVTGIAKRYVPRGYDVLAYDSRAHGESAGHACTYGYYEKRDLGKAIDSLGVPVVAVIGVSLGGAVAIQAAAEDARVSRVVAISTFSDLRTVATERAPFFASAGNIREAIAIAEKQAEFIVDDVSPVRAADRLSIPVLLVHGADDRETPPSHSERIHQALKGPKRLLLVPKSGHAVSLDQAAWRVIDEWLTP